MAFVTALVGANPSRRTQSREFLPGTAALDDQNRSWVYVGPAANAVAAAATCTVTGAFAVNATSGSYTADAAFAAGDYGWVRKTTSPL